MHKVLRTVPDLLGKHCLSIDVILLFFFLAPVLETKTQYCQSQDPTLYPNSNQWVHLLISMPNRPCPNYIPRIPVLTRYGVTI